MVSSTLYTHVVIMFRKSKKMMENRNVTLKVRVMPGPNLRWKTEPEPIYHQFVLKSVLTKT